MAWSWSGSVAPGETWTRYVLIGAGELPASPKPPTMPDLQDRTVTAGAEETFTGTGEAGTTVHITVAGQETSAEVGTDGKFSANITIPANYSGESADVTYWATSTEGGISEMQTATVQVLHAPQITLTTDAATVMEEDTLDENWYNSFIKSFVGDVTHTTINTNTPGTYYVTYTAKRGGFTDATANLTVKVLPKPAELSQTTATKQNSDFALSATMTYTGGKTYSETGFVYGALQNPTLTLNDETVTTSSAVNTKNGNLTATVAAGTLAEGITYYARAYAKCGDTVIYGPQSTGFGLGVPHYGTFSVTNSGSNTFTITRTGGSDGEQTVYYRTANGSAIGGTHFTHAAGSVTFANGVTEQIVTVTELGVTNAYSSNGESKPATAYSNANRTYSLEIYRVEGGATIGTSTATRTMTKDSGYNVDRTTYTTEKSITNVAEVTTGTGGQRIADSTSAQGASNTNVRFLTNRYSETNYYESSTLSTFYTNLQPYLSATASGWYYRHVMKAYESEDGWEHAYFGMSSLGDVFYTAGSDGAAVSGLTGQLWACTFQQGKSDAIGTYMFPDARTNGGKTAVIRTSKAAAISHITGTPTSSLAPTTPVISISVLAEPMKTSGT